MTGWGYGSDGVVAQEAGWGWMSSGVAQVTWVLAFAGMTEWGVGVTGMVGLCGPSTSWRVNTTSALGRLEAVLTRHFAQDERRGRRIGGSWVDAVFRIGMNKEGEGDSGVGFWIPAFAGMAGVVMCYQGLLLGVEVSGSRLRRNGVAAAQSEERLDGVSLDGGPCI